MSSVEAMKFHIVQNAGNPWNVMKTAGYAVLAVHHSMYSVLKDIVLVEWKTGTFLQAGCVL